MCKYWGKKSYTVRVSKEGFEPQAISIAASANGWYIGGNIIFGVLIGWFIVDPFNGGMYNLTPEKIDGETWFCWFLSKGGKAARVVNELMPGLYVDHEGNCYEHDPEMVLVLGTVSRIGEDPLLTPDMFK